MPTMHIDLPVELDEFVATKIRSGVYRSADEVVQAALRAFEEDEAKASLLQEALEAGLASGVAEGDVFARVRERTGLSPRTIRA